MKRLLNPQQWRNHGTPSTQVGKQKNTIHRHFWPRSYIFSTQPAAASKLWGPLWLNGSPLTESQCTTWDDRQQSTHVHTTGRHYLSTPSPSTNDRRSALPRHSGESHRCMECDDAELVWDRVEGDPEWSGGQKQVEIYSGLSAYCCNQLINNALARYTLQ